VGVFAKTFLSLIVLVCFQDYLLPEEYVQTMKPLRAKAPEMALPDVYTVIREDLHIEVLVQAMLWQNSYRLCCTLNRVTRLGEFSPI
jgi:hypothetical protein